MKNTKARFLPVIIALSALFASWYFSTLAPPAKAQNTLAQVPYSCTITLSTNTTTQCQPVPGVGLRNYVQSYQLFFSVAGTTTTVGLNDGTGTNCASSTVALTPVYVNTTATPVGANGIVVTFGGAGLQVPFNTAVCAVQAGTTAGTAVVTVNGYIGQ